MMSADRHDHLISANCEIRAFLQRVDALVHGTGDIEPDELRALGRLLEVMAPEIAGASSSASVDAVLQAQIREYTDNLRALQAPLDQVRCVMLARRAQIESAQRHIDGLQGWVNAYRQTG